MPRLFKRTRVVVALLAALALVATACGGDDDDDDDSADGGSSSGAVECLSFEQLYGLVGPESTGFDNWSAANELITEIGGEGDLPDMPLEITAPGAESGTYDSFIEIVLGDIAEARVAAGAITEDEAATTRNDYSSQANDNAIIEGVSGSEGSLGWVGFAFADQNQDTVKLLQVDGGSGCVAPNADTIADGTYPVARNLYIYVNTAKVAENPALKAYVDFYVSDTGYEAVAEADYVQLPEDQWAETVSAWEGAGGGGEASGDLSGEVVVSGSSTVEPISALVGELFSAENSDVAVRVDGPGTGDGFQLFCEGQTDISDASRQINEEEIAACEGAGIEYVELVIAIDGLSVITNSNT